MKKLMISLLALIFSASLAFGQIADPNAPLQNDPSVRFGKLENGLTYYIQHNEKPAERAEFYLVTNVGAIQETPAQDGLAHFLEHMALNGTKNLPGKMMLEYFQTQGVEFGRNINAGTGVEYTMYMLNNIPVTRQGIIDTALLIMHDYSAFVTNDPAEVEKERGVIIEEWRTRRTADWRMHEKELPYLYGDSKYATCTLIGSKENLETFDPIEIKKFYETWYRPDLQAVIVVGDIDVDAIESQLKTLFADIPARENPEPKVMHQIPNNDAPIVGVITDPEATNTQINVYFKEDVIPMEMRSLGAIYLTQIIQNLISGVINERLDDISKKADAPFLYAYMTYGLMTQTKDAFQGGLACKEGEGVTAFTALMTELEKVKRYGFTEAEYERAKTNLLRRLEMAKDNASTRQNAQLVNPLMINFLFGYPYMDPTYEYEVAKGYLSLLPLAQINAMIPQLFNFSQNAVVIYKAPEKEGLVHPTDAQLAEVIANVAKAEIAAPVEEAVMEPLVDPAALQGSPVKKEYEGQFGSIVWELQNGIKVIVKPTDFNKEEVIFNISNDGGRSLIATEDLPSFESNVFVLYSSTAGVSKFPATTLQKMLTGKMVSVAPFIESYSQGVDGMCSPKDFETLLQLTYLYYTAPRFSEEEFASSMNQLKAVVPNLVKQPNFQLQTELTKVLYGDNPRKFVISPEMLEKVSIPTMERVYKSLFSNAAGSIVRIVGNVNPEEIKPFVEKYIGSIPTEKKAPKWVDTKENIVKGEVNHTFPVEMTTPKTTVALVITADVENTLENSVTTSAINYILDLIYTESIREEEGGTYGVSSYGTISELPQNQYLLQIAFDTDPQKAPKLIELAKSGLQSLADNGPSEDFLSKAKENFLKNIPENHISNNYWNGKLGQFYKYGKDFDTDYEKVVKELTPEKIQKFIKGILGQNNFIEFVMVPKE